MKIATRRFTRTVLGIKPTSWWDLNGDVSKGFLCDESLAEVFLIPKTAKTIWVSIHNRPAADRVEVTTGIHNGGAIWIADGKRYDADRVLTELFNRLAKGKIAYAEVWYE